jgi:hypothetical protein
VWYRTGWLKMKEAEVSISGRRTESVTLTLPPALEIVGAAAAAAATGNGDEN